MKKLIFLTVLLTLALVLLSACGDNNAADNEGENIVENITPPPTPEPTSEPTPSTAPPPVEEDNSYYDPEPEYDPRFPLPAGAPAGSAGRVALTFDDGPHGVTESILDYFTEHGGHATFFVLGNRLTNDQHIERAIRTVELGHEIANHSFNHRNFNDLTEEQIIDQVIRTSELIAEIIGEPSPPFIRVPYLSHNVEVRRVLGELGYALIDVSIITEDWLDIDASIIYERTISQARDGSIILLHDTHERTREAMQHAIPALIHMGFELVTVSELLGDDLTPGEVYRHAHP